MFDNRTIKAPVKGKPHICIRDGYWRVSKTPKANYVSTTTYRLWFDAHLWAAQENRILATDEVVKKVTLF